MSYQVYGIGNALLDIQYDIDNAFLEKHRIAKGIMTYLNSEQLNDMLVKLGKDNIRQISSGGSVANSMVAFSYFGGKGFFSFSIADDESGDRYLSEISEAGLATNFDHNSPRSEGETGRCIVKITPDADRTMNTFLGASIELSEQHIHTEALKDSEYFYIEGYLVTSTLALAAAKKGIQIAKDNNVKIAITLSDPDIVKHFKSEFHELIDDGVDLIFCNEKEALDFTEQTSLELAIEALKKVSATFVITVGPKGSLVFDGKQLITVPATAEKPIDTVGAGDMYAGAFLYGITNGLSWAQSGKLANITSSKVVTQFGPRVTKDDAQQLLTQLNNTNGAFV